MDESAAPVPRITDTWAFSLALSLYARLTGIKPDAALESEDDEVNGIEAVEANGNGFVPAAASGRQPATKAGGKRRKTAVKK